MKITFRGYDKKETDQYLEQLKSDYEKKIAELNTEINALNAEAAKYKERIAELESNSTAASGVLIDAIKRAQDIESDYKGRAEKSDKRYAEMEKEWENHIESCRSGINGMKTAAKTAYQDLLERISQFEDWSSQNVRLESMNLLTSAAEEPNQPQKEFSSDALQKEILSSISADLSAACKELGISGSNECTDSENKTVQADVQTDNVPNRSSDSVENNAEVKEVSNV